MTQVNSGIVRRVNNSSWNILTACFVLLLGFCQIAHSQDTQNDKSLKSYKMPTNLKKHLQNKYKDQFKEVISTVQETPRGPRGHLSLHTNIKIANVAAGPSGTIDSARALAKVFIKEEAELLGFPDLIELRESDINTSKGYGGEFTHIYYDRYISALPLDGAYLHITIGPDEAITSVDASLVPAPSELYQAAAKATITEEEARQSVLKELKSKNVETANIQIGKIRKVAVDYPPYVVWMLGASTRQPRGSWQYKINAFSGEIISKTNILLRD